MKIKQVIIVRTDLGMSTGKIAAQACHAAIRAYQKADKEHIDKWEREGVTKIVLSCDSKNDLLRLYESATKSELARSLICDEGRTEVEPGTFTCCAIGPAPTKEIDIITGSLPLL